MDDLDLFAQMLDEARRVVLFTGAGISTESGIPDFRSPGTGLWTKTKPVMFDEYISSEDARRRQWTGRFDGERLMEKASPNKGHEGCARLIESGKASVVITQNVDNLHQDSGVPDTKVIELHGNASYARCLSCATRYEMADLETQFRATGTVGPCAGCGGIVKSATISFGQAMPVDEVLRAETATLECDLFVVIGSSLQVYPAADLPVLGKRQGARLVILNRDPTPLDAIADLVLHREIGPSMSYLMGIN